MTRPSVAFSEQGRPMRVACTMQLIKSYAETTGERLQTHTQADRATAPRDGIAGDCSVTVFEKYTKISCVP